MKRLTLALAAVASLAACTTMTDNTAPHVHAGTVILVHGGTGASVGTSFTHVFYSNPDRVFVTANAGTTFPWFRALAICHNGVTYAGAWQSQPGPWQGSTAGCPSGVKIDDWAAQVKFL